MCWNSRGLDACAEAMFGEEKMSREREMLRECQHYLENVLMVVFGNAPIDEEFLNSLDILSDNLGVKFPKDFTFRIEKKNETLKQIQFLMSATL